MPPTPRPGARVLECGAPNVHRSQAFDLNTGATTVLAERVRRSFPAFSDHACPAHDAARERWAVFDAATRVLDARLRPLLDVPAPGGCRAAALSPSGRRLARGPDRDAPGFAVEALGLTPDESVLISGVGRDEGPYLTSVATGERVPGDLRGPGRGTASYRWAFAPGGGPLATVDGHWRLTLRDSVTFAETGVEPETTIPGQEWRSISTPRLVFDAPGTLLARGVGGERIGVFRTA